MFEGTDGTKFYYNFCGETMTTCDSKTGSIIGIDKAGNCKILSSGSKNKWRSLCKC
jgi:hypothetical protein